MFPSNESLTQRPRPSRGFPWGEFPAFVGTMRRSDFRPPFPPGFVVLRLAVTAVGVCVRSHAARRRRRAWSFWLGSPTPTSAETTGPPKFLGNPCVPMPCSSTPAGSVAPGPSDAPTWPPLMRRTKAPTTMTLSRLHHTALALAVSASPGRLPGPDARLASRCWPDSTERDWLPAGFQRKVSRMLLHSILLPQACLAQSHFSSLAAMCQVATGRIALRL